MVTKFESFVTLPPVLAAGQRRGGSTQPKIWNLRKQEPKPKPK